MTVLRKLLALLAVFAWIGLTGCSQAEQEEAPVADAETVEEMGEAAEETAENVAEEVEETAEDVEEEVEEEADTY